MMLRTARLITAAALAGALPLGVVAQPSLDVHLEPAEGRVGGEFHVRAETVLPRGEPAEFVIAASDDTESTWVLRAVEPVARSAEGAESERLTQKWSVTTFLPGEVEGPEVLLVRFNEDGTTHGQTMYTGFVSIGDEDVPEDPAAAALREAHPVYGLPLPAWVVPAASAAGVMLALTALALLVYVIRRARRVTDAGLTPAEAALRVLAQLQTRELVRKGRAKEHYTILVGALRTYLEKMLHADYKDLTSLELVDLLRETRLRGNEIKALERILDEADLAKFAKHVSTTGRAAEFLVAAQQFVRQTERSLAPEASDVTPAQQQPPRPPMAPAAEPGARAA